MKKEVIPTQFSCFLLGYTGCHNTGSDVRILTIIDDLRDCFGDDVSITVASFYPENTAKVIPPSDQVTIARVPFIFPLKIFQLVIRHDVTMLVEGSCFKENWAKALLYLFLWGALWAKLAGKKCIAYAIDVGELSPLNRFLTRTICNKIDLLITRTEVARTQIPPLDFSRKARRPTLRCLRRTRSGSRRSNFINGLSKPSCMEKKRSATTILTTIRGTTNAERKAGG
jgi:hypothetical protein